ncbi:MAG: YdcF family protein [Clostridia bacterium]|nr:YdcF family protein [Clostridia bacterium]
MKKKTALIIIIYLLIAALSVTAVILSSRTYEVRVEGEQAPAKVGLEHESGDSGTVECAETVTKNGMTKIVLKPVKSGKEVINISVQYPPQEQDEEVSYFIYLPITVTRTGLILANGYDFGGYKFICLGIGLLELFSSILLFIRFRYRQKHNFFNYRSVLELALTLYFGIRGLFYTALFAYAMWSTDMFSADRIFTFISEMFTLIAMVSMPFVCIFALSLIISNIALIRHEGFAVNNLLGIFISLVLGAGSALCVALPAWLSQYVFTESVDIEISIAKTIISSAFIYFELLLFSARFCCIYSAKREPRYNKDYIIILGCQIRKDGTPLPLLQGRIDRAIRFYKKQLETTGKQAAFIPSGGQGEDEVIPEALSIKQYLIEQGIDEALIFPETKSTSTLENMRFSAEIATREKEDAKLVFSTTNYHVFRSGILSRKAGLKAAGIGAKTKWYFWPNAQIREFIGLLAHEYVINILVLLGVAAVSVLFTNVPGLIEWTL